MTPTTQKSPIQTAIDLCAFHETNYGHITYRHVLEHSIIKMLESERTAYNALLEKVQIIETERDELKKRVDSEYDRGIEDAAKVVRSSCRVQHNSDTVCFYNYAAEAILKLRRVS